MKKVTRFIPAALAASVLAASMMTASNASAEVSANVGYASEYYFRGVLQKESSASAGVDYEEGGFYLGTWAADVGDGLETDLYFGYGFEVSEDMSVGIGYTGYFYTGDFDDTYQEVNLSADFGPVGVTYNIGEWDGFGTPADYTFASATYSAENGIYVTYGTWGDDFDGDYVELGYGTTLGEFDAGVAIIANSKELSDQDGSGQALVFTIGKSF